MLFARVEDDKFRKGLVEYSEKLSSDELQERLYVFMHTLCKLALSLPFYTFLCGNVQNTNNGKTESAPYHMLKDILSNTDASVFSNRKLVFFARVEDDIFRNLEKIALPLKSSLLI